jgi:hypothetical protein
MFVEKIVLTVAAIILIIDGMFCNVIPCKEIE